MPNSVWRRLVGNVVIGMFAGLWAENWFAGGFGYFVADLLCDLWYAKP